jgi:prenyltransferase beta subunit
MNESGRTESHGVTRRALLRRLGRGGLLALAGSTAWQTDWLLGQDESRRQRDRDAIETRGREYVTPETQTAIDQGLAWLARNQRPDGSLGSTNNYRGSTAVTALAGIAFLSAGHVPGRGEYGKVVERCVDFLLAHTDSTGFIRNKRSQSHGPMYDHGFATLFIAEVYGMTQRDELREKLVLAVNLIVNSQNKEGGWRYNPVPRDADLSVTVCQIMALRAARNAGLFVPKSTVDACINYVKRCRNLDGGFRYQISSNTASAMARTAAALVSLYSAGIYEGDEIEGGLRYLIPKWLPNRNPTRSTDPFYYYGQYYAVQAMWHAGGERWETWYKAIRNELLSDRAADGHWPENQICPEYATAMACIILQVPNNYLPIFRR